MTRREAFSQRLGESDSRAFHSKGIADPRHDQLLVIHPGALCQSLSQQTEAEVGVLKFHANVAV